MTLEDLSDVSQVGEVRLQQIHGGALAESFITSDCAGIWDELAVSARGSASWSTRVGERLSAFLALDGHLVASDRGSGGPTWRPVVFLGAGLSWDL